jgi:hypothetical protein
MDEETYRLKSMGAVFRWNIKQEVKYGGGKWPFNLVDYHSFDYSTLESIKKLASVLNVEDPLPEFKVLNIVESKEIFGIHPAITEETVVDDNYRPPTLTECGNVFLTKKLSRQSFARFHRYVASLPHYLNHPFFNKTKRLNSRAECELFITLCSNCELNPLSASCKELALVWNINLLATLLKETDLLVACEFMNVYSLKTGILTLI